MSSATSKPTLYERLGGVYSIAAVVDDFIDRVMNNPILNANPAVDEAHHRVSAAGRAPASRTLTVVEMEGSRKTAARVTLLVAASRPAEVKIR